MHSRSPKWNFNELSTSIRWAAAPTQLLQRKALRIGSLTMLAKLSLRSITRTSPGKSLRDDPRELAKHPVAMRPSDGETKQFASPRLSKNASNDDPKDQHDCDATFTRVKAVTTRKRQRVECLIDISIARAPCR